MIPDYIREFREKFFQDQTGEGCTGWLAMRTDILNKGDYKIAIPQDIEAFLTKIHDAAVEEGETKAAKRLIEELPNIEVMKDLKKGAFALRYNIGNEYVQTMLIDQSIAEQAAIDIVCKIVAAANYAYKELHDLESARTIRP